MGQTYSWQKNICIALWTSQKKKKKRKSECLRDQIFTGPLPFPHVEIYLFRCISVGLGNTRFRWLVGNSLRSHFHMWKFTYFGVSPSVLEIHVSAFWKFTALALPRVEIHLFWCISISHGNTCFRSHFHMWKLTYFGVPPLVLEIYISTYLLEVFFRCITM